MKKFDYLIIGNGIAGLSATKAIRNNDEECSICLIGSEPRHTYYRIRLTKLIAEDYTEDGLLVNDEKWYEENHVEVMLETEVDGLNTKERCAVLKDGEKIGFGKLLIATGSNPFVPPIKGHEQDGVFALRTLGDLNNFKEYLEDHDKVAVIGGGLLGLEAAWSLHELGKEVSVIERGKGVLGTQLDEELALRLCKELQDEGIKIYQDAGTDEILGNGKVEGLKLDTGETVNVGAVLISTGVRSDLKIAEGTELETDRGIKVNSSLETNVDGIYAAGDVAEIEGVTLGLWTAALEMGRFAGDNMTGGNNEYNVPKLFASFNVGDIKLFSAGETKDVEKVYENKDGNNQGKIFVNEGKIVGGILYGDTKLMNKLRPAVFEKRDVKDFLKENELEELYK